MPEEYNPYPLNGQYFTPTIPTPQRQAKEQAREEVLSQVPLLRKVLKRLEQKIAFYDSVNSVPDVVKTKPEEFMHIIAANTLTRNNLQQERSYILAQIEKLK